MIARHPYSPWCLSPVVHFVSAWYRPTNGQLQRDKTQYRYCRQTRLRNAADCRLHTSLAFLEARPKEELSQIITTFKITRFSRLRDVSAIYVQQLDTSQHALIPACVLVHDLPEAAAGPHGDSHRNSNHNQVDA